MSSVFSTQTQGVDFVSPRHNDNDNNPNNKGSYRKPRKANPVTAKEKLKDMAKRQAIHFLDHGTCQKLGSRERDQSQGQPRDTHSIKLRK